MGKVLLKKVCLVVSILIGLGGKVYGQTTFGASSYVKDDTSKKVTITLNANGDLANLPGFGNGYFHGYDCIINTANGVKLTTDDLNKIVQFSYNFGNQNNILDFNGAEFDEGVDLVSCFPNSASSPAFVMPKKSLAPLSMLQTNLFSMATEDGISTIYFKDTNKTFAKAINWQDYLKNSSKITVLGEVNADMDYSSCTQLKTLDIVSPSFKNLTSKITVPEGITEIKVLKGFDITRILPETVREKVKEFAPKADPFKVDGCYITINLDEVTSLESAYSSAISSMKSSSSLLKNTNPCEVVINGKITPTDLAYFKNINTEYLDLSNATFVDADGNESDDFVNSENFANENIKDLIFPIGKEKLVTENNVSRFQALEAAGTYTVTEPASEDGNTKAKYSLTAYINKAGKLYNLTGGLVGVGSTITKNTSNQADANNQYPVTSLTFWPNLKNVQSIKLSGKANAADLGSGDIYLDENGHLSVEQSSDDMGYTQIKAKETSSVVVGALNHGNFTSVDYADLKLNIDENTAEDIKKAAQNDLCFSILKAYNHVADFKLPRDKNVYRIPNNAFMFGTFDLKSICIPANITEIGGAAFKGNFKTTLIYTDNGKSGEDFKYVVAGKLVDEITNENHSITLPIHLKKIESGAFALVEKITDVYVLTAEAPVCEVNSFSSGTLYGWGGFTNVNPITHSSYVNPNLKPDDNSKTFGVLHWPRGIDKKEVMKFTDITRKYSNQDGLQNTDGYGNTLVWPNQMEYNKAYLQGSHGYLWNAWSTTEWVQPTSEKKVADDLFKKYGSNSKYVFYSADGTTDYDTEEYNADYRGWHQFVLTGSVNYKSDDPEFDFARYKEDDWYSICFPFDLDEDEVLNIFGVPANKTVLARFSNEETVTEKPLLPNLCTLWKVVRNSSTNQISLWFTDNLVKAGKDWDRETSKMVEPETNAYGKKILIKAGYPYLIKPYLPADVKEEIRARAKRILTYRAENNSENARDFDNTFNQKLPYRDWIVQAEDPNGNKLNTESGEPFNYQFLGTYYTLDLVPKYSYFMANNGTKNVWYYNVWEPEVYSAPWNANTCIVGPMSTLDLEYGKEKKNFTSVTFNFSSNDDSFTKANRAKLLMNFGNDGQTTEIVNIEDNGKLVTVPVGTVYNMNGQVVRKNASLAGLSKGVYILNGKKYIVR